MRSCWLPGSDKPLPCPAGYRSAARLADPDKVFNAGLGGKVWRAIDFFEGDEINVPALKNLVGAAVEYNQSK